MTVGASLRNGRTVALRRRARASGDPQPAAIWGTGRTVALAAGVVGIAEVLLLRVAAPVLTHVPLGPGISGPANVVRTAGELALHATAVLAPLAAIGVAAILWRRHHTAAVSVGAVVAITLISAGNSGPLPSVLIHVVGFGAAVSLVIAVRRPAKAHHAIGVTLLAAAFVAGRWPLVADALSEAEIASPNGATGTAQTFAEVFLTAAAVVLAIGILRRGVATQWAVKAAVGTGVAMTAMLVFAPGYTAILSLWSTGVTLSLPPIAYVLAAAGLALILVEWLADPASRHLAAGITLVLVAGVTPSLIHLNVTAVAGLGLLAIAAPPRFVAPQPDTGGIDG
jgi:hypothetical protein